jgi:hypothetical protein
MNWSALIVVVAALVYSFFANLTTCAEPSCCAQMEACCGHCACPAQQTCSVAKPVAIDQLAVATLVALSPRVAVELFTLHFDPLSALTSDRHPLAWMPESPPPDPGSAAQARLCVWLI